MFQNAGAKGGKHDDLDDPPRCRANNRPGAGTMPQTDEFDLAN